MDRLISHSYSKRVLPGENIALAVHIVFNNSTYCVPLGVKRSSFSLLMQ